MMGSSTKSLRMRQEAERQQRQQECSNIDGATMQIYKTAKTAQMVAEIRERNEQAKKQRRAYLRTGAPRAPY